MPDATPPDRNDYEDALRGLISELAGSELERLRAIARAHGATGELTDEAVQQGLYELLRSYRGDAHDRRGALRYLVRCVETAAWALARRERRELALIAGIRGQGEIAADTPEERTVAREEARRARALLATLPLEQRRVVLLAAAGFRASEIAEALGLTARQVRKRIEKANRALRDRLEGD